MTKPRTQSALTLATAAFQRAEKKRLVAKLAKMEAVKTELAKLDEQIAASWADVLRAKPGGLEMAASGTAGA